MKKRDYRSKKVTAAVLVLANIMSLVIPAYAGTQNPEDMQYVNVDENLYVNLDYYGNPENVNIVKGINSTKNVKYTDFGDYGKVTNMSSNDELNYKDGKLELDIKGNGQKFYFEGQMNNNQVSLPWNFDISYKLNGVEVEAEHLSGADGLIEINIKAVPNENCNAYLKNNMLLAVIIPIDSKKIYSIDAPGAQIQSIGNISGVMYTGLPGEEKEFTVRLGANDFEMSGIMITLIPGTADSLNNIVDIKNLKDTWKDSGDAMYDSLDSMLEVISSMREDMINIRASLVNADKARAQMEASKDSVFEANEEALNEIKDLSSKMQDMIPYISASQDKLHTLNTNLNMLVNSISELQDTLDHMSEGLKRLSNGSVATENDLSELGDLLDKLNDKKVQIEDELNDLAAEYADIELTKDASLRNIVDEIKDKAEKLKNILEQLDKTSNSIEKLLSGATRTAGGARLTSEGLVTVIQNIEDTNETLNLMYPDLQGILTTTQAIFEKSGSSLDAGSNALLMAQDTLKDVMETTDDALSQSIDASISMIDRSMKMFDATDDMRESGKLAKDTLDDETEKMEEENNFLNIDPEAERISLTSDKNDAPSSMQIVLRTKEITDEDKTTPIVDAEDAGTDIGLFGRVKRVFVRIFEAVTAIFKHA
ncbi:MAG: hypothetical protein Q4B86_07880 [Eubacteriales bacterium]|nr:hypothetical protein [Eubacteriales bacterium]